MCKVIESTKGWAEIDSVARHLIFKISANVNDLKTRIDEKATSRRNNIQIGLSLAIQRAQKSIFFDDVNSRTVVVDVLIGSGFVASCSFEEKGSTVPRIGKSITGRTGTNSL